MESFLTNMSVAARCALADNIIDAMGTPSKIVMKDYYVSDEWVEIFNKHKNGMLNVIFDEGEEQLEEMMDHDYVGLASADLNVVEDILWCIKTIGTNDVSFPFKEFKMNPFLEDFENNKGPHKVSFFCLEGPKQIKTHYIGENPIIEES
jgi:hypothetical protein